MVGRHILGTGLFSGAMFVLGRAALSNVGSKLTPFAGYFGQNLAWHWPQKIDSLLYSFMDKPKHVLTHFQEKTPIFGRAFGFKAILGGSSHLVSG